MLVCVIAFDQCPRHRSDKASALLDRAASVVSVSKSIRAGPFAVVAKVKLITAYTRRPHNTAVIRTHTDVQIASLVSTHTTDRGAILTTSRKNKCTLLLP